MPWFARIRHIRFLVGKHITLPLVREAQSRWIGGRVWTEFELECRRTRKSRRSEGGGWYGFLGLHKESRNVENADNHNCHQNRESKEAQFSANRMKPIKECVPF